MIPRARAPDAVLRPIRATAQEPATPTVVGSTVLARCAHAVAVVDAVVGSVLAEELMIHLRAHDQFLRSYHPLRCFDCSLLK